MKNKVMKIVSLLALVMALIIGFSIVGEVMKKPSTNNASQTHVETPESVEAPKMVEDTTLTPEALKTSPEASQSVQEETPVKSNPAPTEEPKKDERLTAEELKAQEAEMQKIISEKWDGSTTPSTDFKF